MIYANLDKFSINKYLYLLSFSKPSQTTNVIIFHIFLFKRCSLAFELTPFWLAKGAL